MKFGRLIEYRMRNIFLGKSYAECGGGKVKIEGISGSIVEHFKALIHRKNSLKNVF